MQAVGIALDGTSRAPVGDAARAVRRQRRYAAIGMVVLVHILAIWVMTAGMRTQTLSGSAPELQVNLLSPNLGPREPPAPPLDWTFQAPEEVLVPEPEIAIAPDREGGQGIVANGITQSLPPRLDPAHVNERPELPGTMGSLVEALALELRILVLPDGSVADAKIVRSTGQREIDQLAIDCVKNRWRYLPASVNGAPIESWTTVIVRFTPA